MTSEQAAQRIARLGERNAEALTLARLLSFAALAEPALVRQMRLALLPESSAAAEADLWFSGLVQSRSPAGLVFFPEVADLLRKGLGPMASGAWELTRTMHGHLRQAIRIEEELTYLGLNAEANKARIDTLMSTVIAAMIGGRGELANWAGRAVPRLPAAVQNMESASVLRIASDLRLGRNPGLRARLGSFGKMPPAIAAVLPGLGRVKVGVKLTDGALTLGCASDQCIEVPDMQTIAIELRTGERSKIVFVEKGETSQPESVEPGPVELVTLAGETWTVTPAGFADRAAVPLMLSALTDGCAVTLHWRSREAIRDCEGFQILRRTRTAPTPEVLQPGPLQRYSWIDRPKLRESEYSYQVTPVGPKFTLMTSLASSWTPFVRVGPQPVESPIGVTFNRTFESWDSIGIAAPSAPGKISDIGNPGRQALGGDLLAELVTLLTRAKASSLTVYAAMFELDDPELIDLLEKLGEKAHLLLANGASRPGVRDANLDVRLRLRNSGVQVVDRIFPSGKLAHNKFLVICDASGQPEAVWTGNVSWVSAALCARANAAVTVNSRPLAQAYLDQWLHLAGAASRPFTNGNIPPITVGNARVQPWFTPVQKLIDLKSVEVFIRQARQGILFLLSEPGERASLVNRILEQELIFVMGAARNGPSVTLHRNGKKTILSGKALVSPVLEQMGGTKIALGASLQTRMIVIDPLGSHPVVMIGSHAFGERGSRQNDENFLIIENDSEVTRRCAAHIDAYYQHYNFRAATRQGAVKKGSGGDWQSHWFDPDALRERAFWMGEHTRTFAPVAPEAPVVTARKSIPKKVKRAAPPPKRKK